MAGDLVSVQFHLTPSQFETVRQALDTFMTRELGLAAPEFYNPKIHAKALAYFCNQYRVLASLADDADLDT
jgi:hypothetical protein